MSWEVTLHASPATNSLTRAGQPPDSPGLVAMTTTTLSCFAFLFKLRTSPGKVSGCTQMSISVSKAHAEQVTEDCTDLLGTEP